MMYKIIYMICVVVIVYVRNLMYNIYIYIYNQRRVRDGAVHERTCIACSPRTPIAVPLFTGFAMSQLALTS